MAFAAVGLFHGDLQVAAAAGGVEIVNFKGARRDRVLINAGLDVALIDNVAVLANHHQRVAVGRAADNRRVAFLAVRQHVAVGFQLHPGVGNAVKHVGRG